MSGKREEFITPRSIVLDQIERYEFWMTLWSLDRPGKYRAGSIGETIRRLPAEQRAKLAELRSDDLKDVRVRPCLANPCKSPTRVYRLPHTKT